MSHLNPGLLAAYNSLTDRHLAGYFNNARIRRHLQRVGLITRSGRIVPDKEYKHKLIQRAHQRHVRECLAQAIFHKVLDMERLHQSEIKRKLEEFAQRDRIHKIKAERSRRYDEEPMLMLSPRPPTRPKISHAQHSGPEGENSESTESPSSSRPNTAPGKMQRPVRLKPLNSNSATTSLRKTSPRHRVRDQDSSNDTDQPFSYMLDRGTMRHTTMTDFCSTVSPYRLPVINNYVTPVPPLTKKKDRGTRANGTHRGRKLRPTTAPTEPPSALQRTSAQSKVSVRMVFYGKSVHLSHDLMDLRDEVKVFQQHCGGENLCVFKGKLKEGEIFQFVSKRHQGFPFSLTFFLNGLQVERLSSCCEFKHRKGARLGGRHGHFGFCNVEGASPCYKCIIAMGLDKKPTPPAKKVKEDLPTSKSPDTKEDTDVDEDTETHSNTDPNASQEMETDHNGGTAEQKKPNDYEEDFEADDEGPVGEDADEVEEKPSSVAINGMKETETTDENERNEQNRDSDSEVEDASISKVKRSSSVSTGRTSSLSSRDSEKEIEEDTKEITTADVEENLHVQPEDDLTPAQKESSSSVTLPETAEDSGTQDSLDDDMEKNKLQTSEDTENNEHTVGEEAVEETKPDDKQQEPESERATSIQEKLAEAILKESHCSSEPELSDTSTEEDEGASVKTQQDIQEAETESVAGFTSPQPPNTQQDIPEKNKANTPEPAFEETLHDDDETVQPAEERNTLMPIEEEGGPSMKNEVVTASLDEKQEVESKRVHVEQQDENDEVQIETEDNVKKDSQEEVKDEAVDVNTESKTKEEPETQDVTAMLSEITNESALEKEGSIFHTENDPETGVADAERKADDADQSNEQPDIDERDDLTNEAGDDRSTEEKVQDTDGVVDESGEKSSEEKCEDVKEAVEKGEEDKVALKEVAEELEGEDESKDPEVEEEEIHAVEKENEGVEDSKAEDKENEESTERHEDDVIERQEVLEDKEEAERKENKGGQDLNVEDTEKENDVEREKHDMHDRQTEKEDGEQGINKISEEEEQNQKSEDEIVEESEKVNNKMSENRKQEENEVEESKRDETEEREGESVKNEAKYMKNEEEVKDINEISENVEEEKDGNKKDITGENVTQKSEDNLTEDQNEESVLHEEQMEIGSSTAPKDDTEPNIKEEDEPPAGVNNDMASNKDAENGERQAAGEDNDVEKVENDLQDEETQDKLESETSVGKTQDDTDDKPETGEDVREDKDVQEDQKAADDKSMAEEVDKESETSAKTFIENVIPENILDVQETVNNNVEGEDTTEEPEATDNDLISRDAPDGNDGEPEGNYVNKEQGGSTMSRSVESQPVEKVLTIKKLEKDLSIDSEDPLIRPSVLDKADGVDLVSNWITIHQTSRYFQTFIEPLDEIKESSISDETEKELNGENFDAESADCLDETFKSRDETSTSVKSDLNDNTENDTAVENLIHGVMDDVHSVQSKDNIQSATKYEEIKEGEVNRGSLVTTWSRQSKDDDDTNQNEIVRHEDSTSENVINLSTTADTFENIKGRDSSETGEQDFDKNMESNPSYQEESGENKQQQTTIEDMTQLSSVSQTEETTDKEILDSSEPNIKSEPVPPSEYNEPQSSTITVITDLKVINKSENGSQDDSASVDVQSRQSDGNRKTKVIDGNLSPMTVGRDTLSTFSLDDSRFFGPVGYPRLTTAHTENSY